LSYKCSKALRNSIRFSSGRLGVAFDHLALDLDSATHCVHNTREVNQHSVAYGFDDPSAMFIDLGVEEITPKRLQLCERVLLVNAYQATKASDISGKNR
jgi:hypothetical protein